MRAWFYYADVMPKKKKGRFILKFECDANLENLQFIRENLNNNVRINEVN